jgi:hypothetical protein
MNCKYCHLKTHYIDKCPTIICKICKEVGHPQWLCKEKKISKNNHNNHNNSNTNNINLEKKYNFSDEIKKKPSNDIIIQKNMNYYLNLENELWGDLVSVYTIEELKSNKNSIKSNDIII